jgi:macrolide transport system ATP-binding/permease protein
LINGGSVILADEPTGALDSRNGAEVISVLKELAQTGRTVILITHDAHIAAHADRTIEIADGKIVSEGPQKSIPEPAPAACSKPDGLDPQSSTSGPADPRPMGHGSRGPWRWSPIVEATRSALASIRSNAVRTGLTLLGVVIGVASVVALLAIGRGGEADMLERLSSLGTNWILVTDERAWRNPYMPLTAADAEAIAELHNVAASIPGEWKDGVIASGDRETKTNIFGATRLYRRVHHWDTSRGAFFTEEDEIQGAAVTVLGKAVADKLFPEVPDPSGEIVLIRQIPFAVVGVLEEKGLSPDGENYDNRVLVPMNAMMNRIESDPELDCIVVELFDMGKLKETREAIRTLMIERHGKQDFTLYDTVDNHRKATEERTAMNMRLAAIGGISLLVGGIGIMNMMLTSVRERTREIGIRAAAGATRQDILCQFVFEAVVISGVGGVIGLVLGIAIGASAALLSGVTVILSLTSAAFMFLAAASLGVIFGFMPARHAARLDPVAALASE